MKYPNGLFVTPFAHLEHRASTVAREPTKKMSYINQVDHFYFFYKNLNTSFINRAKFGWSLFGISILRIFNTIIHPNKNSYLKLKYFFESLGYCITHSDIIKKGNVREFLNQKI
jgi:hypothetical protein